MRSSPETKRKEATKTMGDLHLLGKVSKTEHPYFDDDYWFNINRVDEGGEADYVAFHKGTNMLANTMSLWDLVEPERRRAFEDFRRNVIEVESNRLESGGYLVRSEQIKILMEMINDLDKKLEKLLDADGGIKSEYINFVHDRFFLPTMENGNLDRSVLRDEVSNVKMMKYFLNEALKLNYPLSIG